MTALRIAVLLVLCMSGKARAEGEVSVGAYLSLTGVSATFGVSTQRGIHLADEQYNAKAKVKVRVWCWKFSNRSVAASFVASPWAPPTVCVVGWK